MWRAAAAVHAFLSNFSVDALGGTRAEVLPRRTALEGGLRRLRPRRNEMESGELFELREALSSARFGRHTQSNYRWAGSAAAGLQTRTILAKLEVSESERFSGRLGTLLT